MSEPERLVRDRHGLGDYIYTLPSFHLLPDAGLLLFFLYFLFFFPSLQSNFLS